eukprot:3947548-Prorocentrum_lima.AAC.1
MTSSLVGSEMCIRDSQLKVDKLIQQEFGHGSLHPVLLVLLLWFVDITTCLLYTSDAADDM